MTTSGIDTLVLAGVKDWIGNVFNNIKNGITSPKMPRQIEGSCSPAAGGFGGVKRMKELCDGT